MKIAIVGGGIVGATMAYSLARAGARVEVYDAGGFGLLASHVGFAWVNGSTEDPAYYRLKADSHAAWQRIQQELPQHPFLHLDGHIEWSTNANEVLDAYGSDGQPLTGPAASPQERLRQKVAWLANAGFGCEMIGREEIRRLEPDLVVPDDVTEVGWYPREGWLAPHIAIGAMLAAAREHGAVLRPHTPVEAIEAKGGRVHGLRLSSGEQVAADAVVVATGAATGNLLASVGANLPLAGTDGMTAITSPTANGFRSVVHTDDLSVRPDGGGRLMIRHFSFDRVVRADHTLEDVQPELEDLRSRLVRLLPAAADARVVEVRVGHRPIPGDGMPVIGPVPGVEGVYIAVAHGAVTVGAAMADIATCELMSGESDDRATSFRFDRFQQ